MGIPYGSPVRLFAAALSSISHALCSQLPCRVRGMSVPGQTGGACKPCGYVVCKLHAFGCAEGHHGPDTNSNATLTPTTAVTAGSSICSSAYVQSLAHEVTKHMTVGVCRIVSSTITHDCVQHGMFTQHDVPLPSYCAPSPSRSSA